MLKKLKLSLVVFMTVFSISAWSMPDNSDPLYLLVSFSMPTASLEMYCQNANQYNTTLVLRGLVNNSLIETQKKLASNNLSKCEWQIEPRLFSNLNITHVPVGIMFENPLTVGSFESNKGYARIDGNISLDEIRARLVQNLENTVRLD